MSTLIEIKPITQEIKEEQEAKPVAMELENIKQEPLCDTESATPVDTCIKQEILDETTEASGESIHWSVTNAEDGKLVVKPEENILESNMNSKDSSSSEGEEDEEKEEDEDEDETLNTQNIPKLNPMDLKKNICLQCGKRFRYPTNLERHLLKFCNKRYMCAVCGKTCKKQSNLAAHMLVHSAEKEHACTVCNKAYKYKVHLKRHMLYHSEKKFSCSECGKSFAEKRVLEGHMSVHEERLFECEVCHKKLARMNSYHKHKHHHSGEKNFNCADCGHSYATNWQLQRHRGLMHSADLKYKCELCPKSFMHKGGLKTHTFTHTGERPHKCDQCDRAFTYKSDLNRHVQIHSDKFKCDSCPRTFDRKSKLENHRLIHEYDIRRAAALKRMGIPY